jgi:integrase
VFSGEDLIRIATSLKSPALSTKRAWEKELSSFLAYSKTYSPLYCTKDQAISYRTDLLNRLSPNSVKTKLAFLSGLWSVLEEVKGSEHIFRGLSKRIKVTKKPKDYTCLPPDQWKQAKWNDLFTLIHYTGCRIAEVAGLHYEDIGTDRIYIRPHLNRPLKSAASEREIPIHPKLRETLLRYDTAGASQHPGVGEIWPELNVNGRWAVHLAKPCKDVTGLNPHGHRHAVATKLRENGYNETVIGRLLGHTPNTVTGNYGSAPWSKLVEAVESL